MDRIRQVHDRDLSPEQLAEREVKRRHHEIDAQILNALEMGNPFDLLWKSPAGINPAKNGGCCKPLNTDLRQEETYCRNRFNQLKAQFEAGTQYADLDAEIAGMIQAGKRKGDARVDALSAMKVRAVASQRGGRGPQEQRFARARALKDLDEYRYRERGVETGYLREMSDAELIEEHEARLAQVVESLNAERAELGLKAVRVGA